MLILAAVSICVFVHVMSMAAAGRLMGIPVERISLFYGPRVARVTLGGAVLELRPAPFGGHVKFGDDFQDAHPVRRLFVAISGCLALLLLAGVTLGASDAFGNFVRGFGQILSGALAPRSVGAGLLSALWEFAKSNPFPTILGSVAGKFAALNLLPLPVLNGGEVVLTLTHWVRPLPAKVRDRFQLFGLVLAAVLFFCWVVALCVFLKRALV